MRTDFSNLTGSNTTESKSQQGGSVFRINNTPGIAKPSNRLGRKRDMMKERVAAHEREMRLREIEDQRIKALNEEIFRIQDSDMDNKVKSLNISMLNEQINQIHITRAEREQIAIEREMQRQQQEMEERMRERERVAQENRLANKSQEELEAEQERSAIRNLTAMSVRIDNIGTLSQTRAKMSAEATRLRGEADFDLRRQSIANEQILAHVRKDNMQTDGQPMEVGHLFNYNPLAQDGFRGQHLQNLNTGISRLNSNINSQIGALYRDSQKMQEEQLRIYREQARIPENSEDENDSENYENSIDLRL